MASTESSVEPLTANHDSDIFPMAPIESLDESRHVDLGRPARITMQEALSKMAFVIYICTIMAYLFLTPARGQNPGRFWIARIVVILTWGITSGVLIICHASYLVRHKGEITSVFFVSLIALNSLIGPGGGGIADGVGVFMVSMAVAALCPAPLKPIIAGVAGTA